MVDNKKKICAICGKTISFNMLSKHLRRHNILAEEYYKQYLLTSADTLVCPICGKPTKFISLEYGFDVVCSAACRIKTINKDNKLQCQICGMLYKNMSGLSQHLMHSHNIITYEHRKQYYDTYFKKETEGFCKRCNNKTKFISISRGYPQQFCSHYCCNRYMFDNETIEHKRERGLKGAASYKKYRKNMTAEQKLQDHISHVNAQKNRSLEAKEITSQRLKNIAANRNQEEKNQIYLKMVTTKNNRSDLEKNLEKEKRSNSLKIRWQRITPEDKITFNKHCKNTYWNNTINRIDEINNKRRKSRSRYMKNKPSYNGVSFDSLWELNVYKYCIENNIPIKREPISLKYIFNDKIRTAFPDFEIDGILVELKGKQFVKPDGTWFNPYLKGDDILNDASEAKHQAMIAANIKIWYESEVKAFLNGSLEVLYA